MRKVRMGGLDLRVLGGPGGDPPPGVRESPDRLGERGWDRASGSPVIVLLHGYGAPGDDLVQLARKIDAPPGAWFLFPEAPLELGAAYGAGRAWWPIDMARIQRMLASGGRDTRDPREVPDGLALARTMLVAMLDEIDNELSPSSIVLGGFSQGAMLACDVALRTERSLAALVLLSGTMICEDEWTPLMPHRRGLPVFQSHGSADPILPASTAARLKDSLVAAGASVAWFPFRGGHEIPRQVLEALGEFLKERRV